MAKKLQKVLVIDDSKLARLTLSRLLRKRNLEVVEASSVSEGLEILNLNSVNNIDAIFIDVMMPEKDGFEGLDIIKSNPKFKHIPCSMYSGELSVEAQKKAIASGAQAYLFKPASGESIESVLNTLEANAVAEEMRRINDDGDGSGELNISQIILTLDNRTKNLARILTKERKEKEMIYEAQDKRLASLSEKVANVKRLSGAIEREEIERLRVDSEFQAEISCLHNELKKMTIVSIVAIVFAVIALILALVT